jgi:hypothetical protein
LAVCRTITPPSLAAAAIDEAHPQPYTESEVEFQAKRMKTEDLLNASKDELNLILSFFSRVDTRASVILAIDTAMLALLASNTPTFHAMSWSSLIAILPVVLIGISLYHLYKAAFPRLEGGRSSLIYFREIAQRTEYKFISEFISQSEEEYMKDVLGQVWRNAEILKQKFDHLKHAYLFLGIAILPWLATLAAFAVNHTQSLLLK